MLNMLKKYKLWFSVGLSIMFILLNILLISKHDLYFLLALPIVAAFVILYIYKLDIVLLAITFLTPLSVKPSEYGYEYGFTLPVELMLFGVLLLVVLRFFFRTMPDRKIYYHPISFIVILHLIWMGISLIASEYLLVSIKFFISQLTYIVSFFFLGIYLFKEKKNFVRFNWLYISSLCIVIVYTFIRHAIYGFTEESGHWVMSPFYNDHTSYGAMLVFFLPFILVKLNEFRSMHKLVIFGILILFVVAIVLSYSRAAWVSLAAMAVLYVVMRLRISFKWVAIAGVIALIIGWQMQTQVMQKLEKNKSDQSDQFIEHVQSISNISSSASNLERINRWQVAIRMWKERPIFGWGSGTYQFVYAPFQKSTERTIISTNAGDLGSTHSEFLRPLSERGALGFILICLLVGMILNRGIRLYSICNDEEIKMLSLITVLSLAGYFTHGLLNDFLDTDKASIPVWAYAAMIVALDVYHTKKRSEVKTPDLQE